MKLIVKIIIFYLFIINFTISQIPEIVWDKTIGKDLSFQENASDFIKTKDGGYLLIGKIGSSSTYPDIWIVKLNFNKQIVWDKIFGGLGIEENPKVIEDNNGDFYISSTSNSNISGDKNENSYGDYDIWVIKINIYGEIIWQKTIGGSDYDYNAGICLNNNNEIFILGRTISGISGNKTSINKGNEDYWLVKMSTSGQIIWDKSFGGSQDDIATKIISDGSTVLIAGYSLSNVSNDKTENSKGGPDDFWILKISETGQKIWDRTFGGTGWESKPDIILNDGISYIICGKSNSPISGDKSESNRAGMDNWVIKINLNGQKIWDKTYGSRGNDDNARILKLRDEGFIIACSSDQNSGFDKTSDNHGSFNGFFYPLDIWLIRTNSSGNKIWDKTIGGDDSEIEPFLILENDNTISALTSSFSNISGDKTESRVFGQDFWLFNLKEYFCNISIKSLKSGNWDDPTVWSCGRVPLVSDNVEIQTGHIININANTYIVKSITINGTVHFEGNGTVEINP